VRIERGPLRIADHAKRNTAQVRPTELRTGAQQDRALQE
jgi:hypothetical protein